MGFVDWLHRLGILRFGHVNATYRNAEERPIELQEDDVLDAKKDMRYK